LTSLGGHVLKRLGDRLMALFAARVHDLAEPGSLLVTMNGQRQAFRCRGADALEVKGVSEPIGLYHTVRASSDRRFRARVPIPRVGLEEGLDLLHLCWERALKAEGRLALVVGEPGIGKSRLVEAGRVVRRPA
jgi:hypothetical protein